MGNNISCNCAWLDENEIQSNKNTLKNFEEYLKIIQIK